MGGGLTKHQQEKVKSLKCSPLSAEYLTKVFIDKALVKPKLFSEENQWVQRKVSVKGESLRIIDISDDEIILEIDLKQDVQIEKHHVEEKFELSLRQENFTIILCCDDEQIVDCFMDALGKFIIDVKSEMMEGANSGLEALLDLLHHMPTLPADESQQAHQLTVTSESLERFKLAPPPKVPPMKIVILVVGTRGDVAPFVNLALALKDKGHDVRIGTHKDYRELVMKQGLKYYPLAGDPRKLSEYMVKTGGRLIPDLTNAEERNTLPEKMQMLKEITYSTWPACTEPDPDDELATPFVAEAIISNPVTYGHIHCAEALSIPLHIMFPQPWHSTKSFPHPLSNMSLEDRWSLKNKLSYYVVDEFMWIGLRSMINDFRKEVLKLEPFRIGEGGESILENNEVPISHMWSPSFVPRCADWPLHVDVVGDFTSIKKEGEVKTSFKPDPRLTAFLEKCGDSPPIFIGFGSMVISDPTALVEIVKQAALHTKCGIIFQSGWTTYGEDYDMLNEYVMVVGSMSHDWLFRQVAGVVHHGGAGTTSAGLRAACSKFICPFFGDQHFWAEMVNRAGIVATDSVLSCFSLSLTGAGPPGCPIKNLTTAKLISAIQFMKDENTLANVKSLSNKMNIENGVEQGVRSFEKNLPIVDMLCEVSLFARKRHIAKVYCDTCGLKMSAKVDAYIHRTSGGRSDHVRMNYRCVKWGAKPPSSVLGGIGQGLGSLFYEVAGGVQDFVSNTSDGKVSEGMRALVARPGRGGRILVQKVKNAITRDDETDRYKRTHSLGDTDETQRGRATYDFDPVQYDELNRDYPNEVKKDDVIEREKADHDQESQEIDDSMAAALHFKDWCDKLDTDGDRHIEIEELSALMDADDAEDFLNAADLNQDGELNFAEMALTFLSSK